MTDTKEKSLFHFAALSYAKRGIPVFPLFPNGSTNAVRWDLDATTNQDQINKWWTKNSAYNIGIGTGEKYGIVVIVFRTPEAWAYGHEMGLPVTPIAKIGKEHHVYCRYQQDINCSLMRTDLPGIVIVGNDRNIIVPPSVVVQNPHTRFEIADRYSWVDCKGLDDLELADVPEWLLERTQVEDEPIIDTRTVAEEDYIDIGAIQPVSFVIEADMLDPEVVEVQTLTHSKT